MIPRGAVEFISLGDHVAVNPIEFAGFEKLKIERIDRIPLRSKKANK
jgi:hypothetical protein